MKRICLLAVAVWGATFSLAAAPLSTNVGSRVTSVASVTSAPAAKPVRTQCEALTKSGTRCKRNAAPGERLCRQHQKIRRRNPQGFENRATIQNF